MLTAEHAWRMLDEAGLICPADEVDRAIDRLAAEITSRFRDAYPLVLCVMNGALFFCGKLPPLLRFPLHLDYVHASRLRRRYRRAPGQMADGAGRHGEGRAVLVVDDILDAGDTLAAIKAKVCERGAASCHVAVLTDKLTGRPKPIEPDFVGLRIPDRFVFGCGLDAYGSCRNLPALYALKQ